MGDRANYVVVDGGSWELRYSHWGGVGVELDMLAGPEAATRFIRAQRGAGRSGWLDDTWCDGAALVDHDRREMRLFTRDLDSYSYRAAVLAVLAETWPGWSVDWAYDGVADLAAHVGLSRSLVRDTDDRTLGLSAAEDTEWVECLVTVTDTTATSPEPASRAYALVGAQPIDVIEHGPGVVGVLPGEAAVTACAVIPDSGVHLDVGSRTAGVWTTTNLTGGLERARDLWPGWQWQFWSDQYARQLAHVPDTVHVPRVDVGEGLITLAGDVQERLGADPTQPARDVVTTLTQAGHDITVGSRLFDHHPTDLTPAERDTVVTAIRAVAARTAPASES